MTVKVKGVEIEFANGLTLVVPPLSLAAVESFQDRLTAYSGGLSDVTLVIDALHASLKRNYPEMTREEVAETVDIANMQQVMFAVMNVSGLVKKEDESGEAKPVE
jgi:hypothetical protein